MPWVRIDEEFPDHPKVVGAGPLGIAMQVAGLCYCNRHLTDGFVPRSAARRLIDLDGLGVTPEDVIASLLAVRMWLRVDGGYQIHDYEHYQPTRQQVLAERERNKLAGQKGGQAKAAKYGAKRGAKQSASGPLSVVPSTVLAERQAANGVPPSPDHGSASEPLSTPPSTPLADRLAKPLAKSKPVPVPLVTNRGAEASPARAREVPVENLSQSSQRRAKVLDPIGIGDALAPVTGNTPSRPTRDQLRWREEATKRAAAAQADREATP